MLHNQILSNKKTKKKLPWILISFGLFALFCIVSVFVYYKYIFFDFKIDSNVEHFGQFGDFIGGTLNPILAFLSFMALLYTIKIQTDELKLSREELKATREELKGSRIAQQEQSESLKLQNEATKLQIFESTFFSLLSETNGLLDDFLMEDEEKKINENIERCIDSKIIHSKDKLKEEFSSINNGLMKTYFIMLYQLLKYIDNSNISNKKFYTNIVRANLDNKILALLAINCYVYDFKEYKSFLDKYSFFEHLDISSDTLFPIFFVLKDYFTDLKIYGNNKELKNKF
ncbi:putative phage abortive infection protein [Aliarcobacter butzleri]|uniref:putative phage abortive infection protein n=1 Tax=Aliarcobacter butzleri TaxID=28197 RepID=UPI0021B2BB56|nr:putative phage abortive infection protein [Aliarcobacter butzleri]MCT7537266.1 putative phage abortive infection protein [Aliarcobacter butzleri]MCT7623670.1 putative phage abortive infection protein [Aliarcobacter butzleri]MDK2046285.1 putative phage abortive infection protein [Aliarcobacter butzleri]